MFQVIRLTTIALAALIFGAGVAHAADVTSSMLTIEKFSAERGDAQSQYFMGEHYEYGDSGVTKNASQALSWYRKAANQGHAAAQFKIGSFYEQGLGGLAKDPAQAKVWYQKAAANGSIAARKRLDGQAEAQAQKAALEKKRQEEKAAKDRERRMKAEAAAALAAKTANDRAAKLAMARKRQQEAEAKKRVFDIPELINDVIGTQWYVGNRGAEFLPTVDMSCVKSKPEEATCFSGERLRIIAGAELLYSVKATLNQFDASGKFNVAYEYNVLEKRESTQRGLERDDYGLVSKEGWQQRKQASCQLNDQHSVECSFGQGQKTKFKAQ